MTLKECLEKWGIGCISDNEPQPLLINCRLGSYAIVSVGRVANMEELIQDTFDNGHTHFFRDVWGRSESNGIDCSNDQSKR